jgi:hypothetical protein
VELSLVEGRWTSDRGLRVEIGALLVAEGVPVAHFLPRAHAHARALGAV